MRKDLSKEAKKAVEEELRVRLMAYVIEVAPQLGVKKICNEYNIPRAKYYRWKHRYEQEGRAGLYKKKPIPHNPPRKTPPEVIEKILEIRKEYLIGSRRIVYYMDRYHGIKVSESTVYRTLRGHGVNKLPKSTPKRALRTKRYAKTVPGHHVQVDVKFLKLKELSGKTIKRYQYTAIDDATRIRALQSIPNIIRTVQLSSLTMLWRNSLFALAQSEQIGGMNFKHAFTYMLKTWACSMCT